MLHAGAFVQRNAIQTGAIAKLLLTEFSMKIANHKRCLPQALAALLLIGGTTQVLAQTSTVNVTGNITGECRITGGTTLTVPLGDVAASSFTGVNSASATAGMQNITLTCTANPGIRMTMSGTQNGDIPTNTTLLALNGAGTAGVARGAAVQLLYLVGTTGTPTTVLVRGTAVTIPTAATVTVRVGARYVQTLATMQAGSANSTATLTFTVN